MMSTATRQGHRGTKQPHASIQLLLRAMVRRHYL